MNICLMTILIGIIICITLYLLMIISPKFKKYVFGAYEKQKNIEKEITKKKNKK